MGSENSCCAGCGGCGGCSCCSGGRQQVVCIDGKTFTTSSESSCCGSCCGSSCGSSCGSCCGSSSCCGPSKPSCNIIYVRPIQCGYGCMPMMGCCAPPQYSQSCCVPKNCC